MPDNINKNFSMKTNSKRIPLMALLVIFILSPYGYAMGESSNFLWPETDYKGEWTARPMLTGNWGGVRTNLADKGFILNVDTTGTYQSIINGGLKETGAFGGSVDYELRMNFKKMGLWEGAFIRLYGKTRYGNFVNKYTGALTAANMDGLFPLADENTTELMSATYYQYILENLGFYLGKLDTLDRDTNEFAGGKGKVNFLNQNFVFNPVTMVTVPDSALGAGLFFLFPDNEDKFSLTVMDADGHPDDTRFDDAFSDGISFMLEYRMHFEPLGLRAHQLFGISYGTKDYALVDNAPWLTIAGIESSDVTESDKRNSWSIYYNYDQILYYEKNDPKQGLGYFLKLGISDKKSNPIDWCYSFGIFGTGVIPTRNRDTFGIGYYYTGVSDDTPGYPDIISNAEGFEFFYNFEVTPWMHITPDIQVISSAFNDINTAIVGGVRVKIDI
ncbi:MAG: carbohydrate porin [Desulfobacteraceae bacterium]|nr:carbohydrate porin [Desulfobacteraceae bacterium]MBC2755008.1 carbohydrate porin [Desulfobacteraceae bacterium]